MSICLIVDKELISIGISIASWYGNYLWTTNRLTMDYQKYTKRLQLTSNRKLIDYSRPPLDQQWATNRPNRPPIDHQWVVCSLPPFQFRLESNCTLTFLWSQELRFYCLKTLLLCGCLCRPRPADWWIQHGVLPGHGQPPGCILPLNERPSSDPAWPRSELGPVRVRAHYWEWVR